MNGIDTLTCFLVLRHLRSSNTIHNKSVSVYQWLHQGRQQEPQDAL